ncbi:MAG: acetyl-CoA carboxyl transferase [Actinobacteria bacterium]|nr:acetyl-CoA carboxyl transferase [Actinomycetota bacterium]
MLDPADVLRLDEEWDAHLRSGDPLAFPGYAERLAEARGESLRTGRNRHAVVVEGRFEVLGGSMGAVHGEKVVRAVERAVDLRLPLVCLTRSGGARMQEGMIALVQMGRTAAAMERHRRAGLLSVAVHRSPTTGGVLASYGSLCDVRAAEAGAVIGFAGPRVVEQTTGAPVERSHSAASALAAGLVDAVVAPGDAARWVAGALGLIDVPLTAPDHLGGGRSERGDRGDLGGTDASSQPGVGAVGGTGGGPAGGVGGGSAWAEVRRARRRDRPTGIDHARACCTSWTELTGGDPVVRVGLATVAGRRTVVLATDRYAGDGRPRPAGYRLARRGIGLAERLGLPVVSFVDTPGADPSSASENDGLAREIAETFAAMAGLATPSVAVCVGEGGSGGALALAWADVLLVQDHAVFSVIGPEGAAAILERDASRAPEVAELLALTSADLVRLGVADATVGDGADNVREAVAGALDTARPGGRARRADAASAAWLR